METINLDKDYKSFKNKVAGEKGRGLGMLSVDEVWNGKFLTEEAYDTALAIIDVDYVLGGHHYGC